MHRRIVTCVVVAALAVFLGAWRPSGGLAAEMTQDQAAKALTDFFVAKPYYPISAACLKITPGEYRNRGFAFTVDAADCLDEEGVTADSWRVDAVTGEVFVQNAKGKYQAPVVDARLVSADAAEALVLALPEVQQEMKAHKNAFLMLEGHPDRETLAANPAEAFYDFYFGHDMGDHTTRLWTFRVNALSREMLVTDPVEGTDVSLEAWRKTLEEDGAPGQK